MAQVIKASMRSATVLINPESASLKRVAWAFGCAKKGSDEERALLEILLAKVRAL